MTLEPRLSLPESAEQKAVGHHECALHNGKVQKKEGDDLQVVTEEVQEPERVRIQSEREFRDDRHEDGTAEKQEDPPLESGTLSDEKSERNQEKD